ncbi:MAG: flagellar hook-length control protein FliK [Candidatus Eremiobacteraeota bacterium]|nr:flagellar hook-length control protein FliK [Candidatus Eremiobacteraeota bacterium]
MAFLLGLGVLGQVAGHLGSHHKTGIDPSVQANPYAPTFGNVLNGQMDALGASDPLAQLTSLVQNGTPISTVVDRLAGLVAQRSGAHAGAVAHSIKSALSPPSNAPPGTTAAQEVAALARRLQSWLGGVAGGADQRVGQQSDTSGHVLDANRARELPAPTDPESVSSQLDVSALAQSLLAQVAASFGAVSSAQSTPLASSLAHQAVTGFSDRAKAATQSVSSFARAQAGQTADAPDVRSQTTQTQTSPGDPSALLARMLMRAANVDARVNANAVSAVALAARGTQAATRVNHGEGVAPATASSQLEAALSEIVSASAQARNDDASPDGESGGFRDFTSQTNGPVAAVKNTAASDALAFAAPAAPAPFHAQLGALGGTTAASPVDPNAIVEQVVKGLSMRTQTDGTSEVRMRLVPEQLGEVMLRLTVAGANVSATALAQNADVRNALVAHQHQLARSLADAGLKLTGFTVNLSGGDAGSDRNRDRTSGFGRHYAVHEVTAAGQTDSSESTSAGPAILPESTLALFNYLA